MSAGGLCEAEILIFHEGVKGEVLELCGVGYSKKAVGIN